LKNVGKMSASGDIHYDGERISTANERKAKMKTLTLVLLAVMVTGYAQETKVVEPPKALLKAQKDYEKEAARVLEPVNLNYLKVLESIKRDLGIRGDTAGMVAVQKAIDEVKVYLKNEAGTDAETAILGKWAWDGKNTINITKDGQFTHPYWGKGTWEYNEHEKAYHLLWSNSANDALTLSKDGKTLYRADGKVAGTRK